MKCKETDRDRAGVYYTYFTLEKTLGEICCPSVFIIIRVKGRQVSVETTPKPL